MPFVNHFLSLSIIGLYNWDANSLEHVHVRVVVSGKGFFTFIHLPLNYQQPANMLPYASLCPCHALSRLHGQQSIASTFFILSFCIKKKKKKLFYFTTFLRGQFGWLTMNMFSNKIMWSYNRSSNTSLPASSQMNVSLFTFL